VINVSWDDAKTYVTWLSRKTRKTYRLLSVSEREYVTRAGTTTPFWWGFGISTSQANYNGTYTYAGGAKGEYRERTMPVESFQPNPWGLYQVHGNVHEWVEDCDQNNYISTFSPSFTPSNLSASIDRDCNGTRGRRGGSWYSAPENLRSAASVSAAAYVRDVGLGFRLGRTLTP
jgi:formylglycine-generating enzyme required for sulfatase activity